MVRTKSPPKRMARCIAGIIEHVTGKTDCKVGGDRVVLIGMVTTKDADLIS
jgi:hypothetical protein